MQRETLLEEMAKWDTLHREYRPGKSGDHRNSWRFNRKCDCCCVEKPEIVVKSGGTVIDGSNVSCTPYQTAQIGNRTWRRYLLCIYMPAIDRSLSTLYIHAGD